MVDPSDADAIAKDKLRASQGNDIDLDAEVGPGQGVDLDDVKLDKKEGGDKKGGPGGNNDGGDNDGNDNNDPNNPRNNINDSPGSRLGTQRADTSGPPTATDIDGSPRRSTRTRKNSIAITLPVYLTGKSAPSAHLVHHPVGGMPDMRRKKASERSKSPPEKPGSPADKAMRASTQDLLLTKGQRLALRASIAQATSRYRGMVFNRPTLVNPAQCFKFKQFVWIRENPNLDCVRPAIVAKVDSDMGLIMLAETGSGLQPTVLLEARNSGRCIYPLPGYERVDDLCKLEVMPSHWEDWKKLRLEMATQTLDLEGKLERVRGVQKQLTHLVLEQERKIEEWRVNFGEEQMAKGGEKDGGKAGDDNKESKKESDNNKESQNNKPDAKAIEAQTKQIIKSQRKMWKRQYVLLESEIQRLDRMLTLSNRSRAEHLILTSKDHMNWKHHFKADKKLGARNSDPMTAQTRSRTTSVAHSGSGSRANSTDRSRSGSRSRSNSRPGSRDPSAERARIRAHHDHFSDHPEAALDSHTLPTSSLHNFAEVIKHRFAMGVLFSKLNWNTSVALNSAREIPIFTPYFVDKYYEQEHVLTDPVFAGTRFASKSPDPVNTTSFPPHVFKIAAAAYHRLQEKIQSRLPEDQCLIATSQLEGAGKSYMARRILEFLLTKIAQERGEMFATSSAGSQAVTPGGGSVAASPSVASGTSGRVSYGFKSTSFSVRCKRAMNVLPFFIGRWIGHDTSGIETVGADGSGNVNSPLNQAMTGGTNAFPTTPKSSANVDHDRDLKGWASTSGTVQVRLGFRQGSSVQNGLVESDGKANADATNGNPDDPASRESRLATSLCQVRVDVFGTDYSTVFGYHRAVLSEKLEDRVAEQIIEDLDDEDEDYQDTSEKAQEERADEADDAEGSKDGGGADPTAGQEPPRNLAERIGRAIQKAERHKSLHHSRIPTANSSSSAYLERPMSDANFDIFFLYLLYLKKNGKSEDKYLNGVRSYPRVVRSKYTRALELAVFDSKGELVVDSLAEGGGKKGDDKKKEGDGKDDENKKEPKEGDVDLDADWDKKASKQAADNPKVLSAPMAHYLKQANNRLKQLLQLLKELNCDLEYIFRMLAAVFLLSKREMGMFNAMFFSIEWNATHDVSLPTHDVSLRIII